VQVANVKGWSSLSLDLLLDHYLEILVRKPGALAGATALIAALASGAFTGSHQGFCRSSTSSLVGVRAADGQRPNISSPRSGACTVTLSPTI
jgi:hypothetical protein